MLKRCFSSLLVVAWVIMGCGCQATPEDVVVTSKNDGVFEERIESSAQENGEETPIENKTVDRTKIKMTNTGLHTDAYSSTDGSITYSVSLEETKGDILLPLIQVTPKNITSEQAKQIAEVLFAGADIYEYSADMSRIQLEEAILALRQHISNRAALVEYYGGDEVLADQVTTDYKNRITEYEALYESAPEEVEAHLCDWEFHPQSYYDDPALGTTDDVEYNRTEYIKGVAIVDGIAYKYSVANRESSDYRIHNVHAYVDESIMNREDIYSLQSPSDAEVEETKRIATELLEQMDIGSWALDSCVVSSFRDSQSGKELYQIDITASPIYNGVKLTHHGQLSSLKTDDTYASNYYYEEITFCFSQGHLIEFFYYSPHEIVSVVSENVQVLSFEEILSRLKKQLCLIDSSYYMNAAKASVSVETVELGLTRIRIKNNQNDFYLVPTYTFYGIITPFNEDGSNKYYYMADGTRNEVVMEDVVAVINAVDGTFINTELGY